MLASKPRKPSSRRTLHLGRRLDARLAESGLTVREVSDPLGLKVIRNYGGCFVIPSHPEIFIERGTSPDRRRHLVSVVLKKHLAFAADMKAVA